MMGRWQKLRAGDRMKLLVVLMALTLGAYGGLIYPVTQKGLADSEKMIKRRLNRIKTRTQIDVQTQDNPRALAKTLAEVDKDLAEIESQWAKVMQGFLSLEDSEAQHSLLLEISTLAQTSGVQVVRSGDLVSGSHLGAGGQGPLVDKRLGRPLLQMTARSNYWQLLSFLDGLSDLSYRVSVVHLVLTARYDENPKDEKAKQLAHNIQPGALDILLILSI
jgi:hypothetical protein